MLKTTFIKLMFVTFLLFLNIAFNLAHADAAFVARPDVKEFINMMVKKHQFNKQQLIALFSAVKIRPQVIKQFNKPLEKEPWKTYQMLFVSEWRIEHGVKFWNKYEAALRQAEKEYGVPAAIIVATIGIETKYGTRIGGHRVMDALTNLGFGNSPRAPFFRKELEQFLLLAREQHLDPMKIMGSYAGAIGQPQFMPSSYRYYAVNFSKTGKIDLMHNEIDVIGSIANYYKKHGWQTGGPIAVPALIIGDRYHYLTRNDKINQSYTIAELARYGMVPKVKISPDDLKVKVIELQNRYNKEYWIAFRNFDVIKRYNASDLYAMAVYQLSYYITSLRERLNNG